MGLFKKTLFWSLIAGLSFFILALLTIKDYNFMWDGRSHFARGQAFLHLFLTGQSAHDNKLVTQDFVRYYNDYLSRTSIKSIDFVKAPEDSSYRKSIYKYFGSDAYENTYGHPPLSDIGAAFFNLIFYEKLGLLRDDLAYNLFAVFLSSVLVGIMFYWMKKSYGIFPAIISILALSTYPLFWAESHFNIKDVPLTVFFTLSIWAFWQGIVYKSKKWIVFSSIFAGCALATKFNVLFLPFILIPWFVIYFFRIPKEQRKVYHNWWWLIFVHPAVMFSILFVSYPYLWLNPWQNLLNILTFYKDIGMNIDYTPGFRTVFGFNIYPLIWILFTTYPLVIILSIAGSVFAFLKFLKEKYLLPQLFLLWLLIPIVRVFVPQSAIYDGVRQIMEYIPAMSLLAGYGAYALVKLFPTGFKNSVYIAVIISFLPLVFTIIRLHPVENVYFNSFVGGLSGAREKQLTGWGNTDGGIYGIAVDWLNKNAERKSHVAVAFSDTADFYIPSLREDLIADNQFSGYLQKREYIIALTHDSGLEQTYRMFYPEKFLKPLFEYKIDDVTLVKVWKNEKIYLKKNLSVKSIELLPELKGDMLQWDLGKAVSLMNIDIAFTNSPMCSPLNLAYFQVSNNGSKWAILQETYPGGVIDTLGQQPRGNRLIAPFAGIRTRYVSLVVDPKNSCLLSPVRSVISVLE